MLTGTLLFILLPAVFGELERKGYLPVHGDSTIEGKVYVANAGLSVKTAIGIWVGATLLTAFGRVLADVHWITDTMGGASLSAGTPCASSACLS